MHRKQEERHLLFLTLPASGSLQTYRRLLSHFFFFFFFSPTPRRIDQKIVFPLFFNGHINCVSRRSWNRTCNRALITKNVIEKGRFPYICSPENRNANRRLYSYFCG